MEIDKNEFFKQYNEEVVKGDYAQVSITVKSFAKDVIGDADIANSLEIEERTKLINEIIRAANKTPINTNITAENCTIFELLMLYQSINDLKIVMLERYPELERLNEEFPPGPTIPLGDSDDE